MNESLAGRQWTRHIQALTPAERLGAALDLSAMLNSSRWDAQSDGHQANLTWIHRKAQASHLSPPRFLHFEPPAPQATILLQAEAELGEKANANALRLVIAGLVSATLAPLLVIIQLYTKPPARTVA